jgi:hypothetical protein
MAETFTEEDFTPKAGTFSEDDFAPNEDTSALGAAGRSLATSIIPSIGSAIGFKLGEAAGTAAAPFLGPLAPISPFAGGAVGGVGAGMGAKVLQDKALETLAPEFSDRLKTLQAEDQTHHPWASAAGRILGMAPSFGLAPGAILRGTPALAKLALGKTVTEAEKQAAKGAAAQIGAQGGLTIGPPLIQEHRLPTGGEALESAAAALLFGGPRDWVPGGGRAPMIPFKGTELDPLRTANAVSDTAGTEIPTADTVLPTGEPITPQPVPADQPKEQNAIPEQAAGEVGVLDAPAVRQEVGVDNGSVQPTRESAPAVEAQAGVPAGEAVIPEPAIDSSLPIGGKIPEPPPLPPEPAVVGESVPRGEPTANMNAVIDMERVERGVAPLTTAMRKSNPEFYADAIDLIARDPGLPDKLILQGLQPKPKPLSAAEHMVLLREKVITQNELTKAQLEAGNSPEGEFSPAGKRAQELQDRLDSIERSVGTGGAGQAIGQAFQIRKAFMDSEFALSTLRARKLAEVGYRKLEPLEEADLKKTADAHKAASDAVAKYEADKSVQDVIDQATAEVNAQAPTVHPDILAKAEKLVKAMKPASDKALERLKLNAGLIIEALTTKSAVPLEKAKALEILSDLGTYAGERIASGVTKGARFTAEMVSKFGESIRPHIGKIWDLGEAHFNAHIAGKEPQNAEKIKRAVLKMDSAEKILDATEKIAVKMANGERDAVYGQVYKLVHSLIESNRKITREELINYVHGVLLASDKTITRLEAMDAMSGRGIFHTAAQDEVSVIHRDMNAQVRILGHQQDVIGKRPKPKSGYVPDKMSDAARREEAILRDLEREHGVVVTDPKAQLAGALQARKTWMINRINDLRYEIAKRTRRLGSKKDSGTDPELESLKSEYAQVKADHDAIFKVDRTMTDEQRLKLATDAAKRSEENWTKRLEEAKKGNFDTGAKRLKALTNPELLAIRARRDALKDAHQELFDLANPKKTPEERQLSALKSRLTAKKARLLDQMASGDFSPRVKRPPPKLDPETVRLRAEVAKIENEHAAKKEAQQLAQRDKVERFGDFISKWYRASILSGPQTIGKLGFAAIERMIGTPVEEAVGSGYAKLYPKFAATTARGGGMNMAAEQAALQSVFRGGLKDAWDNFRMRPSELEQIHDPRRSSRPNDAANFVGMMHAGLKAPVKRAEYARSMVKRTEAAERNGEDIRDPEVRDRIMAESYKDGERVILSQANKFADWARQQINLIDKTSRNNPHSTPLRKAVATITRFLFPIIKIPTNYVAESFAHTPLALAAGHAEMFKAMRDVEKGMIKKIPPEQADMIWRHLTKGFIGSALMLVGYFNPDAIGGYYQEGERRKPTDVKVGGMRVFGVNIPRVLIHNPALEMLQFGSTIRRFADSKRRKKDTETRGIASGITQATSGLVQEVPMISEGLKISKLFHPNERMAFLGEIAKSTDPQVVQFIANQFDKDMKAPTLYDYLMSDVTKRKTETVGDYVKSGIPGLRNTLPVKK